MSDMPYFPPFDPQDSDLVAAFDPHSDQAQDEGEGGGLNKLVSIAAERAALGSMLIDPDAIGKAVAVLNVDDFFRATHKAIYSAMLLLHDEESPIDFVSLVDKMDDLKLLEPQHLAYITGLVADTPTALYVMEYVKIIKQKAFRRNMVALAGGIAQIAYDAPGETVDVLAAVESAFYDAIAGAVTGSNIEKLGSILTRLVPELEERMLQDVKLSGIPTGFTMLDRILGGLPAGDLIIIAARPGMGKSSFVLSMIREMIRLFNGRIAFYSLEMTKEQLAERLLANESDIDGHRLRTGDIVPDEMATIVEASNRLYNANVYVDDRAETALTDIRSSAKKLHAEGGLDAIVVDYMQLMQVTANFKGNRQDEIARLSRGLKALAKELNVPVIALSQLSRAVEQRADKRPVLSDLRESGQIEQDAAIVLFLYREDYYIEDTDRQNIADVLIAKHRHGGTGTVSLFYRPELTRFSDLEIVRTDLEY